MQDNDMIDSGDQYPEGTPTAPPEKEPKQEDTFLEPDAEMVDPPPAPAEEEKPGDEAKEDTTPNPYDQQFQEQGLNKQFKDMDDMIARVPFLNQYTTRVSQENSELKKRIEEFEKKPPVDPTITPNDEFWADPTKQLDNRYLTTEAAQAFVRKMQTQEAKMLQMQVDNFASTHDDFEDLRGLMHQIGEADPGYYKLKNPLESLHREARRITDTRTAPIQNAAQEQANQSRSKERQRAKTTGTGNKPTSRQLKPEDLYNMSLDDLRKNIGYSDEQ